jgi:hydroxyacylglutathione hydrolase
MTTEIYQFPCLKDNYGVLIHDSDSGATAAIDAPDGEAVVAAAHEKGWTITELLITHHHFDHTQGIPAVRAAFPAVRVVGPAKEAAKIQGLDVTVGQGDFVKVGALEASVIETPGHTAGHVVYYFEDDEVAFCADTLFALGCGRVFETPLPVMWDSLCKLAALPAETQIFCGHEYTEANARFSLTIEPENALLRERAEKIAALRRDGKPTVPTTIALELATNPFLRAEQASVQAALGMAGADPATVFAEIRTRKDKF